ncbi:MAG TPA: hypothetical protein VJS15_05830 [Allosphingosinicella sp.]|nr:hypothetical protein [Allosphingosinicella sp.]
MESHDALLGYLNALRGDNAAARQNYQIAARLRNRSAAQSLAALESRQSR